MPQSKDTRFMKNEGLVIPPENTNKALIINFKQIEIFKMNYK